MAIHSPQSWIDRNPAGEWNVARLIRTPASGAEVPAKDQAETVPLQLQIDQLRLKNGRLQLRDHLPARGFVTTLKTVNIDLEGFTLAQDTPFKLALDLARERQERLDISGHVTIKPLTLDLPLETKGVPLAAYLPYYQEQTSAVIGGNLQASTRLQITPEKPLLLSDTCLEIDGLDLPLAKGEGLKLASAILQGGRYDLAANRLEAAELTLTAADLRFGLQKASPEGSKNLDFGADNTCLYIQDATDGRPVRTPFDYRVEEGGLLEPNNKLVVKVAAWLNTFESKIHIEPSFTMVYRWEKEDQSRLEGSGVFGSVRDPRITCGHDTGRDHVFTNYGNQED